MAEAKDYSGKNATSLTKFKGNPKSNASYFTGDFRSGTIDRDPLIAGFAFIFWVSHPVWLPEGFKEYTERNFRAFSGISDIELGTAAVNEGFTNSESHFATGIQRFEGFSLTHNEYSGSPTRNYYTDWVYGIRDPATGIARYPKDNPELEYTAANHTGQLMYIMTRPDADNVDKSIIEFACLYEMCMPTKVPMGHLNFTAGTNDATGAIEIPFKGVPRMSANVTDYAADLLKTQQRPFITMPDYKAR